MGLGKTYFCDYVYCWAVGRGINYILSGCSRIEPSIAQLGPWSSIHHYLAEWVGNDHGKTVGSITSVIIVISWKIMVNAIY